MGSVCYAAAPAIDACAFDAPGAHGNACRSVLRSAALHNLKKEGVR